MSETPQAVVTRWAGNKARRPAVAVKHGNSYKIVNEEDFDEDTMELFAGKIQPHNINQTAEEVRATLTEADRLALELETAQIESEAAQAQARAAEDRAKAAQDEAAAKIKVAAARAAEAAAATLAGQPKETVPAEGARPKRGRPGKAK